ncbi:MAG: hypothetical protein ACR2P8_01335 [Myxococcota bacterium]
MPLLLYPGYHKTGSTVVETLVLPALDARYLGRHYGKDSDFDPAVGDELEARLVELTRGDACEAELGGLIERLAASPERTVLATEALLCPAGFERVVEAIGLAARRLADPGALQVLLTLRRQSELIVSRYLHDLNTKVPALAGASLRGRLRRWLWPRTQPPYSLDEAIDAANPPCAWPMCLPRGGACACRAHGGRVSIHLPLYDFARLRTGLEAVLPAGCLAVADLVDPVLRTAGAERVAALLARFGESLAAADIEAAFAEPLNTQDDRNRFATSRRPFTRADLGEATLAALRARLDAHYRESNASLARALPEFGAYLEPPT